MEPNKLLFNIFCNVINTHVLHSINIWKEREGEKKKNGERKKIGKRGWNGRVKDVRIELIATGTRFNCGFIHLQ